jgi:hypothetical protein
MWLNRQVNRIRAHSPVTFIDGTQGYGAAFIVAELIAGTTPVLWLDFSDWQPGETLSAAERLSAESWGLPHVVPVTSLAEAAEILAGFCAGNALPVIALTGADRVPELTGQLLAMAGQRLHVIISGPGDVLRDLQGDHPGSRLISRDDLRITMPEARSQAFGSLAEAALQELVEEADGAFEPVLRGIHAAQRRPPPEAPAPGKINGGLAALSAKPASLFDTLLRFQLWQAALLECLRCCPARLDEVIDQAGEECLARGEVRHFWRILAGLPAELRNGERVLYWLLMTSVLQEQPSEILPRVLEHLNLHDAPRLRALAAALDILPLPLHEAGRAHELDSSELNELLLAQVSGVHGNPALTIVQLHRLFRYFQSAGRVFRQLQAALTLANTYLLLGRYRNARYWARFVLSHRGEHEVPEVLRLCATGLYAYVCMLLGDVPAGRLELDSRQCPPELIGVRFVDVYLAAAADYRLLAGGFTDAVRLYRLVLHSYSSFTNCKATSDLVRALLRAGETAEALTLARNFHAASADQSAYQRCCADCTLGSVLTQGGPEQEQGAKLLAAALNHAADRMTLHAPLLAQSGINLARWQLLRGDVAAATETLELARPALAELSREGWNFYAGSGIAVQQAWELWQAIREPLHLNFLGHEETLKRKASARVSLRWREILLVLACHPAGLSGDRLAALLDVSPDKQVSLRSNFSRLKRHYPVKSRPYRIDVEVTTDVQMLLDLIQQGRLDEAVSLYEGPLLPESDVVFIRELRHELEESLRQAVLQRGDGKLLFTLARRLETDLQLWEQAVEKLPAEHPVYALAVASLVSVRAGWEQ